MDTLDPKVFRAVMGHFATGVTVVTYQHQGKPAGMTANAFMSVSIDPPLVLISVKHEGRLATTVQQGDLYGVSFLPEEMENVSTHFGGRPIDGLEPEFTECMGTPVLTNCLANIVARVVDIHPAGDHLLYIGQIEYLGLGQERKPLIFYSGKYKQLIAQEPQLGFYWGSNEGW